MYPSTLQAISYLSPNWFEFYQAVVQACSRSLSIEIRLEQGQDPLEDSRFLGGQIDLAFICGLPFIRHHQRAPEQYQVLAAPVLQSPRYQNCPIYFSDVIVHANSEVYQFHELAGKTFGYNDRGSNSGYNLVQWHLLKNSYPADFLGPCLVTGSHQISIQWVVEHHMDWAAIDSTVLEQAFKQQPELTEQIRVIQVIGPSPMPPIVAASHLGSVWIEILKSVLLNPDSELEKSMIAHRVQRYQSQTWKDYEILATLDRSVLL